jgi:hypothetical protein
VIGPLEWYVLVGVVVALWVVLAVGLLVAGLAMMSRWVNRGGW